MFSISYSFSYLFRLAIEVGFNARCKINRMFDKGDIRQHQKKIFYNSARAFYERAFKCALDNLPQSDVFFKKHAEVINWEYSKDTTIDRIAYFV